jgi:hypothetical protein
MSGFLSWMKSNIVIVLLGILTVVPLPVAWYFSSGMNSDLRDDRKSEAQKALRDVTSSKVTYSLPPMLMTDEPIEINSAPNAVTTEFFREERAKREAIVSRVKDRAIEFNSKGRGVLLNGLFPEPSSLSSGQILRPQFAQIVVATGGDDFESAYDSLFERLRINAPVDSEILREQLAARKAALMNQLAPGTAENEIDEATREQIKQQLIEQRLGAYETYARDTAFYADASILPESVARAASPVDPSMNSCFSWQADYWLIDDVLSALASANDEFDTQGVGGNVLDGVVKRVEAIAFKPMISTAAPAQQSFDMFSEGGQPTSDDLARQRARENFNQARQAQQGAAGAGFVAKGTFTGRSDETSNLYDVRIVDVTLVASYEKLPALINSISSYNFMTVLDADIYSVEQWEQIENGYYAGSDFVVRVELEIETLWLRSWTKQFMPASVREQLGIPADETTEGPA